VIYLANPCGGVEVGFIATPAQGNGRPPGVVWCADNGVFGSGYPGDAGYLAWLAAQAGKADCLFAVAPDVVADAAGTLTRSAPFLDPIRRLGYPVALAAQDGLEQLAVPWADFDVLSARRDRGASGFTSAGSTVSADSGTPTTSAATVPTGRS
jgi:hypothetical protein